MKNIVRYKDIAQLNVISNFCRLFYKITGMIMDINDIEGLHPIKFYKESEENNFCRIIKNSKSGFLKCIENGKYGGNRAGLLGKEYIYRCHMGLTEISVPIIIKGEHIATLTTGQVLIEKPSMKEFQEIEFEAKKLDLCSETLKTAYFNSNIIGIDQINNYVDVIKLIINYIFEVEDKIIFLKNLPERSIIEKAKNYVEENYKKKISVKDIAKACNVSPYHYEHLFKKEVGMTFIEYLNLYKLSKAKNLLHIMKILDVCNEIGFNSISHFYKLFKRHIGCTPKEYKDKTKNI